MTRTAFPFQVDDLSTRAGNLHRQLVEDAKQSTHLPLMTMPARAAGDRNFQHVHAEAIAADQITPPTAAQHLALWARLPADRSMTEREISAELNHWRLSGDAAILRRTLCKLKLVTRTTQDGSQYHRMGRAFPHRCGR